MELDKFRKGVKSNVDTVAKFTNSIIINPFRAGTVAAGKFINGWKNRSDRQAKEYLMFPDRRNNLWANVKRYLKLGMLVQAGFSMNMVFLLYYQAQKWWANRPEAVAKLRQEILSELPVEIEIIDDKIKRAEANKDYKEAAQLKRVKGQLQLKMQQVAGQYGVA